MKKSKPIRIAALACLFLACLATCGQEGHTKKIQLDEVFAIPRQKGLNAVGDESYRAHLEELKQTKSATRNIFVVGGKEIKDAVKSTRDVMLASGFGDGVAADETGNAKVWLVVFLGGAGSSPPTWTIESVEMSNMKVKVKYKFHENAFQSLDVSRYFFWIPLGDLKVGKYDIELFNSNDSEITLLRRVSVFEMKKK